MDGKRGRRGGGGGEAGGRSVFGGCFGVPLRSARRQPLPLRRRDNVTRVGPIGPSQPPLAVRPEGSGQAQSRRRCTTDLESQRRRAQMWQRWAQSQVGCGSGASPVPVQMWQG